VEHRFDITRALGELETRADAWRFIQDFAAGWATSITDADGVTDEDLDAAEARLGVRLPVGVREAYQMFGRRTDLTSGNGTLWPPDELRYDQDNNVLAFRAAHQGVAFFGVSLADPTQEDPPTFMYTTYMDKTQESWEPFMDRFSLACVDMVLWESVEAGPRSDGRDEATDDPTTLFEGLTQVQFPRYPNGFDSQWYVNADMILRYDSGWVAVCARTDEALDAFREAHPGDWVNA
jgi:hypothetical protein